MVTISLFLKLKESPHVLIYGANLWYHIEDAEHDNQSRMQYVNNIDNFTCNVRSQWPNTTLIFAFQDIITGRRFAKTIMYNTLAGNLLKEKHPHVVVWDTGRALSEYLLENSPRSIMVDGAHMNINTYRMQGQFLLNFLFNEDCRR